MPDAAALAAFVELLDPAVVPAGLELSPGVAVTDAPLYLASLRELLAADDDRFFLGVERAAELHAALHADAESAPAPHLTLLLPAPANTP